MLLLLLVFSVAAMPVDVSTEIDGKVYRFVKDGEVNSIMHPDFDTGSPCHPVPQFVDASSGESLPFSVNNTGSSPLSIHFAVSSDSLSPLVTPNRITIDPNSVGDVDLMYSCGPQRAQSAHHFTLTLDSGDDLLTLTFTHICHFTGQSPFDFAMVVLLVFSVSLVVISSIAVVRPQPSAIVNEERTVLEAKHAVGFVVLGSGALVCLFFFGNYIVYVLTFCLMFSSFTAMVHAMTTIIKLLPDSLRCPGESHLPFFGSTPYETTLSGVLSFTLILVYLFTKHWLLNNLLGASFVFLFLGLIKIVGFRVGALLLFLAFFYDIFWVFYSEPIFGGNVMVSVATQIDLPIKLECLRFQSLLPDQCSMIGLGDLVLPGVTIAFARVHDDVTKRSYYFVWAVVAYVVALVACGTALVVSQQAQPALLYISPCLLVALTVAGFVRGDFKEFWTGSSVKSLISIPAAERPLSEMRTLG